MPAADEPSPDEFETTVDGVRFSVEYDPSQPGTYHYTRRTQPAAGYGFSSRRSDRRRRSTTDHVEAIREFLAMCDPVTGYLEDESDDEGT